MNTKTKVIIGVILLSISYGAGYFTKPSSVTTTSKSKEQTKQETKKEVSKTENKNKVVVIKEVKNKDGSVTKETTITDRGTVDTDTKVDTKKEALKESETKTVVKNDIGLTIQALAYVDTRKPSEIDSYGIYVKKRIIGNISAAITAITDKQFDEKKIGLGLGYDF